MNNSPTRRLFSFDAARALLMFLGVPYHVARIYGEGRTNAVLADEWSAWLGVFAEFIHSFRMEAFFAVAGFFSLLILLREPAWPWLRSRLVRILVPLGFCSFLFSPIQSLTLTLYELIRGEVQAGNFRHAYWARLLDNPVTILHLWFLHTLLLLTLGLAIAAWLIETRDWARQLANRAMHLAMRVTRMPFWLGALWLSGPIALVLASAPAPTPFVPMFFVNKVWTFAPFFLVGAAMAASNDFRDWFLRPNRISKWAAPGFSMIFVAGELHPEWATLTGPIGAAGAGIYWLHLILSLAGQHLDRHSPLIAHLCDASFSVYVFHLPIALLLALPLMSVGIPPVPEFGLLVVVTTTLALGLHEIVRRSCLLSLMLNGVSPSKFRRMSTPR